MKFTIYSADCSGNQKNCVYPNTCAIDNEKDFKTAVAFDHVCGKFKNSHRNISQFIEGDVAVMDCDNEYTDNSSEWMTFAKIDRLLPSVAYAIAPSRHNNLVKDGKSARPRFHVYFPHGKITDAQDYANLKAAIYRRFPFFDGNAIDAARFIYGSECDEIVWHEGEKTIDSISILPSTAIPQGQRNSTMSRFAARVIKRYGTTNKAYQIFLEEAAKCDPPLGEEELSVIWRSAAKFGKKIQSQKGYVVPDEYNDDFAGESLKPADYSDIGQAKVLAREYRNELRFTTATDYLRFNGTCWVESKQQAIAAMEEFLDLQLADAKDEVDRCANALIEAGADAETVNAGGKALEKTITPDQMDVFKAYVSTLAYRAFVMKRRDMKFVISAMQAAKPMLEIKATDLDKKEFLLNTPEATYYLPDGLAGAKQHNPEDYLTKLTMVSPGQAGKEIWLDALDTIFCGDKALTEYVQQIVGMASIGKVYVESLIIAYGEGRNGKSTFWNTISRVLGTYSGNMSADTLTIGCKRNVKPELAETKGKRLIIAAELEEGMRLNTSVIKQLCSTDEVLAEKKYKDPFSFIPSHTLVLYTNHLPRVGANDPGTWRRLIVIPFNARIEGAGDVKNYADHLVKHAGPFILSWIIEGAQKVIQQKFKLSLPDCVADAIKSYRENNDWLGHFMDERCELNPAYRERSGELYQGYRTYCIQAGEYIRSKADFYSALEILGIERKKAKTGIIVLGLKLKAEEFLG